MSKALTKVMLRLACIGPGLGLTEDKDKNIKTNYREDIT